MLELLQIQGRYKGTIAGVTGSGSNEEEKGSTVWEGVSDFCPLTTNQEVLMVHHPLHMYTLICTVGCRGSHPCFLFHLTTSYNVKRLNSSYIIFTCAH